MKQFFILAACLLGTFQAFSQENAHIAISSGFNIPLGNYGSDDITKEDAGLAKTGFSIDVSGYYKLNKHFGLSGLFRHQRNGFNEVVYKNVLQAIVGNNLTINSKPYRINTIMIGLNSSVPIKKNLSWESKLLLGSSTVTQCNLETTVNIMGTNQNSKIVGHTSSFGSLLLGTGLKYQLNEKWILLGTADYWITKTKPEFTITEDSGSGPITRTSASSTYINLSSLNISLGLAYKIK
ncbi:MAG: outer membrane beta-barrel protein [Bacteroidia bacterium]